MTAPVRRRFQVMVSGLLLFGSLGTAFAVDRFVSPTGSDTANDCLSSAGPCRTIQRAVSQAASGDTLELARGSYAGLVTIDAPPSVTLTMLGGWSTDFATRDPQHNKTRVQSRGFGAVFLVGAGAGSVVDVTLDGVTITNGKTTGMAVDSAGDGSLMLTLSNCTLRGNKSGENYGGGITAIARDTSSLQLVVADSTFKGNLDFDRSAGGGGAIFARTVDASALDLTVTRSLFTHNRSVNSGGAIDVQAFIGSNSFDLSIVDSTFLQNRAQVLGGAIAVEAYSSGTRDVHLTNTLVAANKAKIAGGGISTDFSTAGGSLNLTNSTLTVNVAGQISGGIAMNSTSVASLTNSIVWGNKAPAFAVDDIGAGDTANIGFTINLDHDDIGALFHNGGTINDMGGNINANPLLINPPNDLHLRAGSPCVDAGTCTGAPTTDFEGDPRPSGASCDIGADEFVP
jgi:hypothetical protein